MPSSYGGQKEFYDAPRADILKAIEARPGALVIDNKSVIEALKPGEHGAHAAHFGAIRGRNDWKKIDQIMIIGREEPSPAKVERIARAFAAHDDAPSGIRPQIRDAEIVQAVDRIRPIFKDQSIEIILLSPDPAAAEATEAREERIAIIMHDGGLSLADAIRIADGLDVPDPPPAKEPDENAIASLALAPFRHLAIDLISKEHLYGRKA